MKPGSRKSRSILLARKAEEQERIREIHSALGGSAEAFDRASEQPPDEEVSLGSRIDAYIQLQTARRAAGVEAPAPDVEPPVLVIEPPVIAVEPPAPVAEPPPPVAEAPLPAVEPPAEFVAAAPSVRRRASAPVHAVVGLARLVVRACLATARRLVGLASLLVRAVGHVLRALLLACRAVLPVGPRAVAAIGRSVRAAGRRARPSRRAAPRPRRARPDRGAGGRESERLSPTVLERVQGYTPAVTGDVPAVSVPVAPPPPPAAPREEPRQAHHVRRPRVKPRVLLVAAALAGAAGAAVLLVDRGHGSGGAPEQAAAVRAMADASGSRTSFQTPLAYADAMTRLALANGRTQVDAEPSCDAKSTWKHWSCDAKGRPSIGPFAGRWVIYRCTPSYTPQPGAPATLVVNCRPRTPPPSSTA